MAALDMKKQTWKSILRAVNKQMLEMGVLDMHRHAIVEKLRAQTGRPRQKIMRQWHNKLQERELFTATQLLTNYQTNDTANVPNAAIHNINSLIHTLNKNSHEPEYMKSIC